jgi:MSHA pilin protein MshC
MGNAEYKSQEFRDKVVSALRYAQKSAVSHRRLVCVTFSTTTVAVSIDSANNGASCAGGAALQLPGANAAMVQSGDASNAFFSPVPANFNFNADGTNTSPTANTQITVFNQPPISVEKATGYVN